MKVVHYHRHAKSGFHIHAFSSAEMFYVPDEDLMLIREQHGSFGSRTYSLTTRAEILAEAKLIAEGRIPNVEGVTFSEIQAFEYERYRLQELIQNLRLKAELETQVESGIEDLLKQVKSTPQSRLNERKVSKSEG